MVRLPVSRVVRYVSAPGRAADGKPSQRPIPMMPELGGGVVDRELA